MLRAVHNWLLWHEWSPHVATSNLQELTWIYCAGHAGDRCNKRAYSQASEVTIAVTLKMGTSKNG